MARARVALIAATILWGSSFFVMKGAVSGMSPFLLQALRSTIAFVAASAFLFPHYRGLTVQTLVQGFLAGSCLFAGNMLQVMGIAHTTPGKSSFLTASYCILTPFLFWLFTGKRPRLNHVLATILCVAGIGLVSLDAALRIGIGDALTLAGAIFFAAQIALISAYSQQTADMIQFGLVQIGAGAVLSVCALLLSGEPVQISAASWPPVLYLGLLCTAATLLLQNLGQKTIPPAQASIIMSLESVFGVLFSVLLYGERLTLKLIAGFAVIFVSVILSEIEYPRKEPPRGADQTRTT